MVHEGAKLNNFNAVCLIIVAHEGAKFNEPGDGLTNQLCWRNGACVRGGNLRGLKTLPPFNFSINYSWFLLPHSRLIILNHSERNLKKRQIMKCWLIRVSQTNSVFKYSSRISCRWVDWLLPFCYGTWGYLIVSILLSTEASLTSYHYFTTIVHY